MFRAYLVLCLLIQVFSLSLRTHRTSRFHQDPSYFQAEYPESRTLRAWNTDVRSLWNKYNGKILKRFMDMETRREVAETREQHVRLMGLPNKNCDDGHSHLDIDWNGDPLLYTCYQPKVPLPIDKELKPILECEKIPPGYWPKHVCMNQEIVYTSDLPTHEMHRPLWPVFGEYLYVPPQRWLHSVEHGSIVMLYHPCAEQGLIDELKAIVKSCIRKHVIAANTQLPQKMPLALVAWGCRLQMNSVDVSTVVHFIKTHGRTGPEGFLTKEGQYNLTLLEKAEIPPGSDYMDSKLCPTYS